MKRTLSLKSLLLMVAVVAAGLGSMRIGSELMLRSSTSLVTFIILGGLLGAFVMKRPTWTGFAVFTVGYVFLSLFNSAGSSSITTPNDLTGMMTANIADKFHGENLPEITPPIVNKNFLSEYDKRSNRGGSINTIPNLESMDTSMLTNAEIDLVNQYRDAQYDRQERIRRIRDSNQAARAIGNNWVMVILGLIGSSLGMFLDTKRQPLTTTMSS